MAAFAPGTLRSPGYGLRYAKPTDKANMPDPHKMTDRPTNFASIAAIASALAASSCCLPLFPFVAAAGLAGVSAVLPGVRPCLVGASVEYVCFGFCIVRRAH